MADLAGPDFARARMVEPNEQSRLREARYWRNRLFAACCAADPSLERETEAIDLPPGIVLYAYGEPLGHVFFIESGVVSLSCPDDLHRPVEVAMAGPDGLVGLPALLGSRPCHSAESHTKCTVLKVSAHSLGKVWQSAEMEHPLRGYFAAQLAEVMLVAACTARHSVEQRLARILLTASDFLGGAPISITHDRLARLLGVRRASVTVALHILEGEHAVRSSRGMVQIREREQLERLACSCHRRIRGEYRALFA